MQNGNMDAERNYDAEWNMMQNGNMAQNGSWVCSCGMTTPESLPELWSTKGRQRTEFARAVFEKGFS